MKKVVLIYIIIFGMIAAALPLSATGTTETISKYEAQLLISKAYKFARDARFCTHKDETPIIDFDAEGKVVYYNGIDSSHVYSPVIEENLPGGTFEEMCKYAETIYDTEISPLSYRYSLADVFGLEDYALWELFYTDENGKLYAFPYAPMDVFGCDLNVNSSDVENIKLTIISGNDTLATAKVEMEFYAGGDGPNSFYNEEIECKFVKTANGWRIAESEYSVLMATNKTTLDKCFRASPPTGDENGVRIWWLAGVSLAAIVPAALLVQRRRRRED